MLLKYLPLAFIIAAHLVALSCCPNGNVLERAQALAVPYIVHTSAHTTAMHGYTQQDIARIKSQHALDPQWYTGVTLRNKNHVHNFFYSCKGRLVAIPHLHHPDIKAWYFDRGSNKVMVFSFFHAETHAPCIESFKHTDTDLIIFEYDNSSSLRMQVQNPYEVSLFSHAQETHRVVEWLHEQKKYTQVIGVGMCRSTLIYAKAQSESNNKLFDKLILDSPFFSLGNFLRIVAADPLMTCIGRNQFHFFHPKIRSLLAAVGAGHLTHAISSFIWGNPDEITIKKYLPHITVPILFVHGMQDIILSLDQVHELWDCTASRQKSLLVTNNRHSRNHARQDKELYAHVVSSFALQSFDRFMRTT